MSSGTHAGQPVPDFVHGDECLFCHRNNIGPGWQKNAHGLTVRQVEDAPDLLALLQNEPKLKAFLPETTHTLGSRNHIRYLRKDGYGKFDLSSFGEDRTLGHWNGLEHPGWQKGKFENRCAGCHSTGIDAETKTFTGVGIDCYTCHGVVDLNHSGDVSLIFLSKKRRNDVLAITSTCAQCHLRGGRSRSTGLPYANNFVPGDNLFKDYEVKWDTPSSNPGDRHIWINVRDVVVNVSYLARQIEAAIGDGSLHGARVTYSREAEPLDGRDLRPLSHDLRVLLGEAGHQLGELLLQLSQAGGR